MSAVTLSGFLAAVKSFSTFDLVVASYTLLVTFIIISYQRSKNKSNEGKERGGKFKYQRSPSPSPVGTGTVTSGAAGRIQQGSRPSSGSSSTLPSGKDVNWKKQFEGVWLQYKEENFDEFLKFSGTSFALRKVIPVAFFMTRHTLSVTPAGPSASVGSNRDGEEGAEEEGEYFTVKRDFGEGYVRS